MAQLTQVDRHNDQQNQECHCIYSNDLAKTNGLGPSLELTS